MNLERENQTHPFAPYHKMVATIGQNGGYWYFCKNVQNGSIFKEWVLVMDTADILWKYLLSRWDIWV